LNEATTPEPREEAYVSPYFPAPGAGTTGALPTTDFSYGRESRSKNAVSVVQPQRSSSIHSGTQTPISTGHSKTPVRKMSLSDQIMATTGGDSSADAAGLVHKDFEPNPHMAMGTHDDISSPYPAVQRFRVPRSRQASLLTPASETVAEPLESYDVAPHLRIGTQSIEDRYKVGSRRGSRSASVIATPQESLEPSMFDHSALDTLSADTLASKLNQASTGEKARARRPPSRGASMDLGDGTSSPASPAFNVNQRHTFRKPPSRGSSLSLGSLTPSNDAHNLLNTISETFEKDLAAAKGNQTNDKHVPGEYPKTPAVETPASLGT